MCPLSIFIATPQAYPSSGSNIAEISWSGKTLLSTAFLHRTRQGTRQGTRHPLCNEYSCHIRLTYHSTSNKLVFSSPKSTSINPSTILTPKPGTFNDVFPIDHSESRATTMRSEIASRLAAKHRRKISRSTNNPAVPDNGVNQVQSTPCVSDLVRLCSYHDGIWSE